MAHLDPGESRIKSPVLSSQLTHKFRFFSCRHIRATKNFKNLFSFSGRRKIPKFCRVGWQTAGSVQRAATNQASLTPSREGDITLQLWDTIESIPPLTRFGVNMKRLELCSAHPRGSPMHRQGPVLSEVGTCGQNILNRITDKVIWLDAEELWMTALIARSMYDVPPRYIVPDSQ